MRELGQLCEGGECVDPWRYGKPTFDKCEDEPRASPGTFLWWGDPYGFGTCTENRRVIRQPGDYLLVYWMGRYYGFIDESD